jgi:hypothetical protein
MPASFTAGPEANTSELVFGLVGAIAFAIIAIQANRRLIPHLDMRRAVHVQHAPWYTDARLLFYSLAVISSTTYGAILLAETMSDHISAINHSATIASDISTFPVVATYLNMVVVVVWILLNSLWRSHKMDQVAYEPNISGNFDDRRSEDEVDWRASECSDGVAAMAVLSVTSDDHRPGILARLKSTLAKYQVSALIVAVYAYYCVVAVIEVAVGKTVFGDHRPIPICSAALCIVMGATCGVVVISSTIFLWRRNLQRVACRYGVALFVLSVSLCARAVLIFDNLYPGLAACLDALSILIVLNLLIM